MDLGPRYRVRREIGRGGWGRVFLVRDSYLGKDLALKLIDRPLPGRDALEQAEEEFGLLARIEHPGVAKAHDFGRIEGRPYFTAEYIRGRSLAADLDGLSGEALLLSMARIAEAVAFLHRHRVLHLDIKPSNIMIREGGPDSGRPVLIDFGLFRRGIAGEGWETMREIRGSLPYMAPELFRGGPMGPWTDVYALGVTFYRMVSTRLPRWGASDVDLGRVFHGDWDPAPGAPDPRRRGLPADLAQVILKCLSLDEAHRFSSARECLESILRLTGSARIPAVDGTGAPAATIGREREMAEVDSYLDRVAASRACRALLVTGAAGMGQSYFLREIKIRALTRGFRFYLETGHPGLATTPGSLLRFLGMREERPGSRERRGLARWRSFLARLRRPGRAGALEVAAGERRLRHGMEVSLAAGAVKEPTVLAVDGLQFWDEVSIELLIDLVHVLDERGDDSVKGSGHARPPLGVIAAYREEGPAAPLLGELSRLLLRPGAAAIIELQPLGVKDTLRLHRDRGARDEPRNEGLGIFQDTGGSPAKVVALATSRALPAGADSGVPRRAGKGVPGLSARAADALRVLVALRRPALLDELAVFLGAGRRRITPVLALLEDRRLAAAVEPGRWVAAPGAEAVLPRDGSALRRAHERIAKGLLSSAGGRVDPSRVEAVQHLMAAGRGRRVIEEGLRAARYLKSTFQSRAALDLFRSILLRVPVRMTRLRLEIAMDMAALHAQTGGVDEGIRLLREVRIGRRAPPGRERERVLLLLAVLHSRKGEFQVADSLFREGLPDSGRSSSPGGELTREETLHFLNEHAALKMFTGEYDEAARICAEGLRKAKGGRSVLSREASLNLHATLANVALRRFDFDGAIRGLERALCAAEALGSLGNQAVILNNLGKVYSQCDRHDEAIAAFQQAEATCLRIDAGPSLVAVHGNLAILHAKTGKPEAADRALAEARRLSVAGVGPRESFFLEHAAGLTRLFEGRYAEARSAFQGAIAAGRALGDRHVVEFDEIYRAEALLFEARYGEAESELTRLSAPPVSARARMMALARRALCAALLGDEDRVPEAAREHGAIESGTVPFLDAWDGLFLGWAYCLLGREDAGRSLERAEAFFRDRGLGPFRDLARVARVEGMLLRPGETEAAPGAAALLEGVDPGGNRLVAASCFLLRARLGWKADRQREAERRAGLLAEAGAALVGNVLPEWEARIEALRAALRPEGKDDGRARAIREEIAAGLEPRMRRSYLEAGHWKAWARPLHELRPGSGGLRTRGQRAPDPATRAIEAASPGAHRARDRLVARSRSMRKLLSILDRVRGSDLPVLIQGETGTGKETVARAIHEESRRGEAPFVVVDCAALPEALLEGELAGARAGAYTDQTADRQGLLLRAAGGTVLLDGIEHLSLAAQAKLLRVISERRVRPIGGEEEEPVCARFIVSSAKDLAIEAQEGRFRPDLLHRVQVVTIEVPPLRRRTEDLRELVAGILAENGVASPPEITPGAWRRIESQSWPGNVRELTNVIARLSVERRSEWTESDVERALGEPDTSTFFSRNVLAAEKLPVLKDRLERDYMIHHFRRLGGSTPDLCALLGLNRRQLYNRMKRLGISLRSEKSKMEAESDEKT